MLELEENDFKKASLIFSFKLSSFFDLFLKENKKFINENKEEIFTKMIESSNCDIKSLSLFLIFLEENGHLSDEIYLKNIRKLLRRRSEKSNWVLVFLEKEHFQKILSDHDFIISLYSSDMINSKEINLIISFIFKFGFYNVKEKIEFSDWVDQLMFEHDESLLEILLFSNINFTSNIDYSAFNEFPNDKMIESIISFNMNRKLEKF
jgi:hypothetical protein